MTGKLSELVKRAERWPKEAQNELVQLADEIDRELAAGAYLATPDELRAIDEADRSDPAGEKEVAAAFAKFRGE